MKKYFLGVFLCVLATQSSASNQIGKSYVGLVDSSQHVLTVKFDPNVGAFLNSNNQVEFAVGDFTPVTGISSQYQLQFSKALDFTTQQFTNLEAGARARQATNGDGNAGIGLSGIFDVSSTHDNQTLLAIANDLNVLNSVEYAYLIPAENDLSPPSHTAPITPTPGLEASQTYLGADPGLNIRYAWEQGIYGQGISISDVEWGWGLTHEEWNGDPRIGIADNIPGDPSNGSGKFRTHGNNVIGIVFAQDNGFGVTGMVHGVDAVKLYPVDDGNHDGRRFAVSAAVEQAAAGDVVMYEMHTTGPIGTMAQEIDPVIWELTRVGTDNGVIIVAASGNHFDVNGGVDYDSPHPGMVEYRSRGDSGAIIVGAGTADLTHDRLDFSGYGSRINLHAWGESVTTASDEIKATDTALKIDGDIDRSYVHGFNGTSSATPMVASVAVALQSYALDEYGFLFSPLDIRNFLITTGTPANSAEHIGPIPDTKAAFKYMDIVFGDGSEKVYVDFRAGTRVAVPGQSIQYSAKVLKKASTGISTYTWSFPGGNPSVHSGAIPPPIVYSKKGTYPVTLTVTTTDGDEITESKKQFVTIETDFDQLSGMAGVLQLNGSNRFITLNSRQDHDRFGRNRNERMVIHPSGGNNHTSVTFQGVNLLKDHNGLCDDSDYYISVYDGPDVDSPVLVEKLCDEPAPITFSATNPDGVLLIEHIAHATAVTEPWTADVYSAPFGRYCDSDTQDSGYEWISSISLASEILNSSPVDSNYSDMTQRNVFLPPGKSHPIQILPGSTGSYPEHFRVWIDFNKNSSFSDPGELVLDKTGSSQSVLNGNLNIPAGLSGKTRMRVSMKFNDSPTSCSNFHFGEVEDYSVTFGADNYCPSLGTDTDQVYISKVRVNGVRNYSEPQRYSDFTSFQFKLEPNDDNTFSIDPGYPIGPVNGAYRIYIDLNRDGEFNGQGELVYQASAKVGEATGTISIPSEFAGVTTRMRIQVFAGSSTGSCRVDRPGEVEEYTVRIASLAEGAGGNLIKNGDFADDLNHWTTWDATGWNDLYVDNNGHFHAEIWNDGTAVWNFGVYQNELPIEFGESYRATFRARATGSRTIQVQVEEDGGDWEKYSDVEVISINTNWREYSFDFTMSDPTDTNARMEFDLGLGWFDVYIDDVRLKKLP